MDPIRRALLGASLFFLALPGTALADTTTVPPVYVNPDRKCEGEDCPRQPAIVCQGQNCLPPQDNPVVECQGQNCMQNPVETCEGVGCTPGEQGQ